MFKKRKAYVVLFVSILFVSQLVFAANWSARGTYYLTGDETYKYYTTDGVKLSAVKSTSSQYLYIDTYWRTMTTAPAFMLRNSNNEMRSNEVNCATAGNRATGNGNIGDVGYRYYASLRAGWLQYGDDTINIDFTPD